MPFYYPILPPEQKVKAAFVSVGPFNPPTRINLDSGGVKAEKVGYKSYFTTFDGGIAWKRTEEHTFLVSVSDGGGAGNTVEISGLEALKNQRDPAVFSANGKTIKGRLKSFSLEAGNNNCMAFATVTIECDKTADSIGSGAYYSDLSGAASSMAFVESISDSISASRGENSAEFTRQISVKFKTDGSSSLISQARKFADGVFSGVTCAENLLGDLTDDSDFSKSINGTFKKFTSESYNAITNECTFSQTLGAENIKGEYSHTATQNISITKSGIISVSEEGKIRGLTMDRIGSAEAGYGKEFGAAKQRLQNLFAKYNSKCGAAGAVEYTSTTKTIDKFSGEITYSVKADNDPNSSGLGSQNPIKYEKTLSYSQEGANWTATESGTVTSLKAEAYNASGQSKYPKLDAAWSYFSSLAGIGNGLSSLISSAGCKDSLSPRPISRNVSLSALKGVVQYEFVYSTDEKYADNNNYKSIEASTSLNYEVIKKNEFQIINKPILIQESAYKQTGTTKGSQQISVKILGYRESPTAHSATFSKLLNAAKTKASELKETSKINFLESASASCSTMNNVSLDLSLTVARGMEAPT